MKRTLNLLLTAFLLILPALPACAARDKDLQPMADSLTRYLTETEVNEAYEANTGKVIVEAFEGTNPLERPGVLVPGHGPFTWGADAMKAVDNAVALEAMARMARLTEQLRGATEAVKTALPAYVGEKHYQRKHGPNAYYGQK